jgi:hypothetical protein
LVPFFAATDMFPIAIPPPAAGRFAAGAASAECSITMTGQRDTRERADFRILRGAVANQTRARSGRQSSGSAHSLLPFRAYSSESPPEACFPKSG